MKVLVVGNGAREHAIVWKLSQSGGVSSLLAAPGNAGTARIAENVPISASDVEGLLRYAQEHRVDLTVVGPEAPLADGIADRFQEAGLLLFGPARDAARIETSKSFAKGLMLRHGIPTGSAEVFDDYEQACRYVESSQPPVVVKADGVAAGKGVVVAESRQEALLALRAAMIDRQFGDAGARVLIEEFLEGREISVFAFVDGQNVSSLAVACDYKRALDGDTGQNTGGMGSYSPPSDAIWTADMERRVRTTIMEPAALALQAEGCPYRGALYAGLMLTRDGPKVVEFNCRLGDPETQVLLPRLKTDLLEAMLAIAGGDLAAVSMEWDERVCVGVVMASGGYPGVYATGYPISGLDGVDEDVAVFHAGTKVVREPGSARSAVVSDGGRVLTLAALGVTYGEARAKVYRNAARVSFTGSFYRTDIAAL